MTRIDNTAWAAFMPTPDDPWDRRKVAHLHRRAGFGATRAELERDVAAGPAESVERFLNPPDPSEEERAVWDGLRAGALSSSEPKRLPAYWLYRMLFGGDPLRERLTLFWHSHFATSLTKVDSLTAMATQVETLRERALGGFGGLLEAIIADPAMLVWLDGGNSHRERPNENFAREFLELFTLGQGAYSEGDVREAARAFTGWAPEGGSQAVRRLQPEFHLRRRRPRHRPQDVPRPDRELESRRHRSDHPGAPRGGPAPGASSIARSWPRSPTPRQS